MKISRDEIFSRVTASLERLPEERPELGDKISVSALRYILASMVITLGRSAGPTFYRAGYDIGVYKAESHFLVDLEEALNYMKESFEKTGVGIVDDWEVEEDQIVIRMRESATAAGYKVNEKLCYFQAGFIAGLLSGTTNDHWRVRETKCVAEGYNHCEFVATRRE